VLPEAAALIFVAAQSARLMTETIREQISAVRPTDGRMSRRKEPFRVQVVALLLTAQATAAIVLT